MYSKFFLADENLENDGMDVVDVVVKLWGDDPSSANDPSLESESNVLVGLIM